MGRPRNKLSQGEKTLLALYSYAAMFLKHNPRDDKTWLAVCLFKGYPLVLFARTLTAIEDATKACGNHLGTPASAFETRFIDNNFFKREREEAINWTAGFAKAFQLIS